MAITLFGAVGVPTDNGTNTTNPTAFANPPIASMVVGDLCFVYAWCRTSSATIAISNAGGQTWNSFTSVNSPVATLSGNAFWCRYNGTWSAAPSVSFGATTNNNVVMLVFRPTATSNIWIIEPDPGSQRGISTIPVQATTSISFFSAIPSGSSSVAIAVWSTDDDNTWGTLTGTGWSKTGLSAQYRNTSGSDASASLAYLIQTSLTAVTDPAQTETANGNDGGLKGSFIFYEASQQNKVIITTQAVNRASAW